MTTWADKMIRQNQQLMAENARLKKELAEARAALAYLGENYGRLLAVHESVVMDTPEDRDTHARVVEMFKAVAGMPAEAKP